MRGFSFLFAAVFILCKGYACTDFLLSDSLQQVVVARSLEFGIDLESQIRNFPKGTKFTSNLANNEIGMQWSAKYGFLSVVAFQNLVMDGFNEAGLSVGVLWFPGSVYKDITVKQNSRTIAFEDFASFLLSSFSTIEEVKAILPSIHIWFHSIEQLKGTPPIHYSIHDKSGKSLVIEFVGGEMQVTDNPVNVLTNAPEISWHLTNLRNYVNLSTMNKGGTSIDGFSISPIGQGSGLLGIPGDWTPPSRFIKVALVKGFIGKPKDREESVNLAFHLLNMVDIPYGAVGGDNNGPDYTQWIIVKDLHGGQLYYRTYGNLNIKVLNIAEMVKPEAKLQRIPMPGAKAAEKALNK